MSDFQIKNHRLHIGGRAVEYVPTPNKSSGTIKPEVLVLHDTAGRLDHRTSVSWLCDKAAKASAHFVVGRDDYEIVQLAPLNVATWHAGASSYKGRTNVNRFSIGIEIVNPGKMTGSGQNGRAWYGQTYNKDEFDLQAIQTPEHGSGVWMPYTADQISVVTDIGIAIRKAYGIKDVTTHWAISPGRKVDTNPLFPLDHVRGRILGREDDPSVSPTGTLLSETIANVNMRRWPSYADNVIQVVPRGTKVPVLRAGVFTNGQETAKWLLVRDGEHEGWIHSTYAEAA